MPVISFRKGRPSVTVPAGTNLMKALLGAGVPVASSCKGDGVCSKCRIEIVAGKLAPPNEIEAFLRERHGIPKNERVSCQVTVDDDLTVDTAYW